MSAPGTHLRTMAARWCDDNTMARVIDPALADLQFEWTGADGMRKWLVRSQGVVAFWKLLLWNALASRRRSFDRREPGTAGLLVVTLTLVVVATAALDGWAMAGLARRFREPASAWLFLDLLPRVLPLAMPVSLVAAFLWRRPWLAPRAPRSVLMLAMASSVLSFLLLAWIAPATGRAFRASGVGMSISGPLTEMSITDLARFLRQMTPEGAAANPIFGLTLQVRGSIAFAPLALALFLLAVTKRWRERRWPAIAFGLGGAAAFAAAVAEGSWLGLTRLVPVDVAAWAPVGLLLLVAVPIAWSPTRDESITNYARRT
jgi:hypothetical protein